jgi:hypothetical protein
MEVPMDHDHDHQHGHDHTHAHEHGHTHQRYADRAHPEFVILEIGEGVGALIVHTDPELHGLEIEISPASDDAARSHKDVLQRPLGGEPAYSAVFDQIPEGTYTLWMDDRARARNVEVVGASVAEIDWRGAGSDDERRDALGERAHA